jgi:hypothetical protein
MDKNQVQSILILNKFMAVHKSDNVCCFYVRKIISSMINSYLDKKTNFYLPLWIIGLIFEGRSGLLS